ncbi:MAG: S1/P1 nuclease [Lysobacterales bacterium]
MTWLLRAVGLLLLAPAFAHAWGPAGHRIVAELAERQLTPGARAEARRLLALTRDRSLADVATWADDLRDDPSQRDLWRATSPLHFVNFSSSTCRYDPPRDCPGGRCVVAAIERYAQVLGDRSRPMAERAAALRFVVHFVADAHQPLHAGYRRDRGGNRYQLQLNGRGSNLHAVWDTPVLASRHLGWQRYATLLARTPLPPPTGMPAQWAEESCRATRDQGIYPRGHVIDEEYLARMRPLAERRVRDAAARLAALLERELDAHSHR